jgi:hypothetical protein
LYDGDKEIVSNAYGPVATPHIFVFDKKRKLCYEGRVDDMESPFKTPKNNDARNAIDAVLNNQEVIVKTTKVFGCSVKWSEKKDLVEQVRQAWSKEPVNLEIIKSDSLRNMIKNPSDKLRLIHFWTPGSPECAKEFQEFVTINRMYRDRDFEFVSVCINSPENKENVLGFLKTEQASNSNYILEKDGKNDWQKQAVPAWNGTLPYTLLVEPGGKVVYTNEGIIDPPKLKWTIVNNHLIGRFP